MAINKTKSKDIRDYHSALDKLNLREFSYILLYDDGEVTGTPTFRLVNLQMYTPIKGESKINLHGDYLEGIAGNMDISLISGSTDLSVKSGIDELITGPIGDIVDELKKIYASFKKELIPIHKKSELNEKEKKGLKQIKDFVK